MTHHPTAGAVGGRNAYAGPPVDRLLREVEDVVRRATLAGADPSLVLAQVANGLTGRRSGYVERAATRRMTAALTEALNTPIDALKAEEIR